MLTTPDLLRRIAAVLDSLPPVTVIGVTLLPERSSAEIHLRHTGQGWRDLVDGPVTVGQATRTLQARWWRDGLCFAVLLDPDQAGELEGLQLQTFDGRPLVLRPRLGIVEAT